MKRLFLKTCAALLLAVGLSPAQADKPPITISGSAPKVTGAPISAAPLPGSGPVHGSAPAPGPVHAVPLPSHQPVIGGTDCTSCDTGCAGCGAGLFGYGDGCDRSYQFWGGAEYLLWNIADPSLPDLTATIPVGFANVTTTVTSTNGAAAVPGLGAQNVFVPVSIFSQPVLPGNGVDLGDHNGLRGTLGMWLGNGNLGVEFSGFALDERRRNFGATNITPGRNPILIDTGVVPTTVVVTGGAIGGATTTIATPAVIPAQSTSVVLGRVTSEIWGSQLNFVSHSLQLGPVRLGGRLGFRYTELEEELSVLNQTRFTTLALPTAVAFPSVPGAGGAGTVVNVATTDVISTENRFYGGQIGIDIDSCAGWFFISARAQVALGGMNQIIRSNGQTLITVTPPGGAPTVLPTGVGGLLSGPLDQGKLSRARVAVIPEVLVKAGIQVGGWLRLYVSYDAFYLQNTVRPGNVTATTALNTNVTVSGTTNSVNVVQPTIRFREIDTWIRGIGFGGEIRY